MEWNLKKLNKSLFTVLIFVSLITFCVFPTSNSKFFKNIDPNDSLYYGVKISKLNRTEVVKLNYVDSEVNPNEKKIGFLATFNISNYRLDNDTKDKYVIIVNDGCTINSIVQTGINFNKIANNKYEAIFEGNALKKYGIGSAIEVKYTCNADNILNQSGDYFISDVKVSEYINDSLREYYLGTDRAHYPYSAYENKLQKPSIRDGSIYIPKDYCPSGSPNCNSDIFDYIKKSNYIPANGMDYFLSVYKADNITSLDPLLKEFTVTEEGNYYKYTMENLYLSYARTYYSHNITHGNVYYFLDIKMTEEGILNLLKEYLEIYHPEYTNQTIIDIENYIKNNGSLRDLLTGKEGAKSIPGIVVSASQHSLSLSPILDYVYPPKSMILHHDNIWDDVSNQADKAFSDIEQTRNELFAKEEVGNLITAISDEESITHAVYNVTSGKAIIIVHSDSNALDGERKGINTVYMYEIHSNTSYNIPFLVPTTDDLTEIKKILAYFAISTDSLTKQNLSESSIIDDGKITTNVNGHVVNIAFTSGTIATASASIEDTPTTTTVSTTATAQP